MVTRKTYGMLGMAAALVVGAAVCQADQTGVKARTTAKVRPASYQAPEALPTPKAASPLELGSVKPAVEFGMAAPVAAPHCATSSRGFCGRVWDWFTYRPVTHTTVCGKEPTCIPPLYTYFMEWCPVPPGASRAPCAHGQCAAKTEKKELTEKDSSSWLSFNLFGRSKEKGATSTDGAGTEEIRPVVNTMTLDFPLAKAEFRLDGKETGKWRGLPTRR